MCVSIYPFVYNTVCVCCQALTSPLRMDEDLIFKSPSGQKSVYRRKTAPPLHGYPTRVAFLTHVGCAVPCLVLCSPLHQEHQPLQGYDTPTPTRPAPSPPLSRSASLSCVCRGVLGC